MSSTLHDITGVVNLSTYSFRKTLFSVVMAERERGRETGSPTATPSPPFSVILFYPKKRPLYAECVRSCMFVFGAIFLSSVGEIARIIVIFSVSSSSLSSVEKKMKRLIIISVQKIFFKCEICERCSYFLYWRGRQYLVVFDHDFAFVLIISSCHLLARRVAKNRLWWDISY